MSNPATNEPDKKIILPSPAGEAKKWLDLVKELVADLNGYKGVITLLVIAVGALAWVHLTSGQESANSTTHQQNRGDTATAETIRLLKEQVQDLKISLKEEKDDNKELRLERRKNDSLAGEAATVIERLRKGNAIKKVMK